MVITASLSHHPQKSYMKLKQNSDREAAVQLIVGCVQNGYQDKMAELMGYGVPLDQKAKVVHSHRNDVLLC